MLRRWIIRALFLLPLVCVVGLWVASYFGLIQAYKRSGSGRHWGASTFHGKYYMAEGWAGPNPSSPLQFDIRKDVNAGNWLPVRPTLGFYAGSLPGIPDSFSIVFPLWMPVLFLVTLNWLVWRKTRSKLVGGAFPVEPAKPGESKP